MARVKTRMTVKELVEKSEKEWAAYRKATEATTEAWGAYLETMRAMEEAYKKARVADAEVDAA